MFVDSTSYDRAREVKEFDESKIGVKGLVDSNVYPIPRIFVHPPEYLVGLRPPPTSSFVIPTVDLRGCDTRRRRRPDLAAQIRDASREFGFFQIINHGIPAAVTEQVISAIRAFNEQPAEAKAAHYGRRRGSGFSFHTNFDLFQSKAASWRDTFQLRTGPASPDWDSVPAICRTALMEWDLHVRGLGELLMGLLCEGLGVSTDRLKELSFLGGRSIAAHYYPFCPQPDLTLGIGSHTDPGVLTVLLQNDVEGLQVKRGDRDEWVKLTPQIGALVVNIGDILQIISNDEYKSVEHRVVANHMQEPRISIAVFFTPGKRENFDYFGPLPELLSSEKTPVYRNFTMNEILTMFFGSELGRLVDHFRL